MVTFLCFILLCLDGYFLCFYFAQMVTFYVLFCSDGYFFMFYFILFRWLLFYVLFYFAQMVTFLSFILFFSDGYLVGSSRCGIHRQNGNRSLGWFQKRR